MTLLDETQTQQQSGAGHRESGSQRQPQQSRQQQSGDECADDAHDDVTDQSKAAALDDLTGNPSSNSPIGSQVPPPSSLRRVTVRIPAASSICPLTMK